MTTWKPAAAGIASIITGTFIVWYRSGQLIRVGGLFGPVAIALGLIAVAGGVLAIRRKGWRLALAGAACAIYPPHPWGTWHGLLSSAFWPSFSWCCPRMSSRAGQKTEADRLRLHCPLASSGYRHAA